MANTFQNQKLGFLVILLVAIAAGRDGEVRGGRGRVEARGPVQCPRMIDCTSVCQGFPNCCVNGQCICQSCASLSPPAQPNSFKFN